MQIVQLLLGRRCHSVALLGRLIGVCVVFHLFIERLQGQQIRRNRFVVDFKCLDPLDDGVAHPLEIHLGRGFHRHAAGHPQLKCPFTIPPADPGAYDVITVGFTAPFGFPFALALVRADDLYTAPAFLHFIRRVVQLDVMVPFDFVEAAQAACSDRGMPLQGTLGLQLGQRDASFLRQVGQTLAVVPVADPRGRKCLFILGGFPR
ncbi:hypothetical protein D3C79_770400 [compost metagenome]